MRRGVGRRAMAALASVGAGLGQAAIAQTTIQYTYDTLGRVTAVTYPAGISVGYAYDAAGNRTQQTSTVPTPASTAGPVSASVAYNTAAAITLAPTGNYASLAVASNPGHGLVTIGGLAATYTPTSGYLVSTVSPTTGPGGTSAPATVNVTVALPAAPTVSAKTISTVYNTAGAVDLATTSLDDEPPGQRNVASAPA